MTAETFTPEHVSSVEVTYFPLPKPITLMDGDTFDFAFILPEQDDGHTS